MTHSKRKLAIEEIESFRKFLERRGFKCRNGKGRDQLMQVQNQGAPGQNVFCKTAKGAESFGKKVAAEAFYGESCTIVVVEIA